jgi:hypothetical protein
MILIQGTLQGGKRHGQTLQDSAEINECPAVKRSGHTWPTEIALTEATTNNDIEDGPASFVSDSKQIETLLSGAERTVSGRDDLAITVTLLGQLRSRESITILHSPDGWYAGDGYGQSGQYPALLIIKHAQAARVVKAPSQ